MSGSLTRSRGAMVALAATALVLFASACTGQPKAAAPPAAPTTPVWMAGDSLAAALGNNMAPRPYVVAAGAAGFTEHSLSLILVHALTAAETYGDPETMLVMGGANDTNRGLPTSLITDGMADFEAEVTARGIDVIWIVQPAWTRAAEMGPINDWVAARPGAIDCRSVAGNTKDGIHPANYKPLAACVNAALAARGVDF